MMPVFRLRCSKLRSRRTETEETAVETAPEEAEDDAFDGESEDDTTDEN